MNQKLILGLATGSHDCAYAVLTTDGNIIMHVELERDIREKEASGDPLLYFLSDSRSLINIQDIGICSFVSCPKTLPVAKLLGLLVLQISQGVKTIEAASAELITQLLKNSFINHNDHETSFLLQRAQLILSAKPEVVVKGHHHSHLAEAFYAYGDFSDSKKYVLSIDGGGWDPINNSSIFEVHTSFAEYSSSCKPPPVYDPQLSLGILYSEITLLLGFSISPPIGSQQGSVMGLAAYGDPGKYLNDFTDDLLWMNTSRGNPYASDVVMKVKSLVAMLDACISASSDKFQVKADIAAALQEAFTIRLGQLVRRLILHYSHITQGSVLLFSGGCSLNCAAIGRLLYDPRFDDIRKIFSSFYVSPVPYDAGLSIGAAALALPNYSAKLCSPSFSPFLGRSYSNIEIMGDIRASKLVDCTLDLDDVCSRLSQGQIGAVFRGRSESGRRALCNRSIIADPRNPSIRDIMNNKVKKRPVFRPFAPVLPSEDVIRYFSVVANSPFMSFALPFNPSAIALVPSVVHKDGTGRLQTVSSVDNPWLYHFLKRWEQFSGVPILINTSFNDNEPIVESPSMAIQCFLRTDIDFLMFPDVNIILLKNC